MLQNTSGSVIAGIGIIILLWSVMKIMISIEDSLNDIWRIKQKRPFFRRYTNYIAIMFICPILFIAANSMTVLLQTQFSYIVQTFEILKILQKPLMILLGLVPMLTVSLMFAFMYIAIPFTRVDAKSGIIGGLVAGFIYTIVQFIYIHFQIGLTKYSAVYGSFAAFPFFLFWLNLSWLIVLLGAEVSFTYQNFKNAETVEFSDKLISQSAKKLIALCIVHISVKKFNSGEKAPALKEIMNKISVPARLLRAIIEELIELNILAEVMLDQKNTGYQPALNIDTISINYVLSKIENKGATPKFCLKTKFSGYLSGFNQTIEKSKRNVLLKDI
ncbi:YihY/virulence factor BrkB family protein [bacterium]|nr:YihY/virulence factor BrkB family protein [bacterium]